MKHTKHAAQSLSKNCKTDKDFMVKVDQITKLKKDDLMMEFLNLRMEIDPAQVFRVLQLSNPLTAAMKS